MLEQLPPSVAAVVNKQDQPEVQWGRFSKTYTNFNGHKPTGKLNLGTQPVFSSHRSGWEYAIDSIRSLHNDDGILFDGFLEKNFTWHYQKNVEDGVLPYKEPWIGVFHNPPNSPDWFFGQNSLEKILDRPEILDSLTKCKGLFVLSTMMKQYLETVVDVPISVVYHPTEIPSTLFDFDRFIANDDKKVVMVGYWLRKLNSLNALPLDKKSIYRKIRLMPYVTELPRRTIEFLIKKELETYDYYIPEKYNENTYEIDRLSDSDYDAMLSENIVFLNMYTTSANNAVIESIARGTPMLVNPLPATVEYLGRDYPLYFDSLDEAAEKAVDMDLIHKAHKHLLDCDMRKKLTQECFLKSIVESDVYKSI